jgi:serpin B
MNFDLITISIVLFCILLNVTDISSQRNSKIATANNYFALNLLNKLFDEKENVVISPMSISTAFSMLYFGARGRTAQELEEVLGYSLANLSDKQLGKQYKDLMQDINDKNSSDYELKSANRVVIQSRNPILKEYENKLKNYFNSSVQIVDFLFNSNKAIELINDWVSEATRGKIEKLLDQPLSPLSVLVLLNAVYFKVYFSLTNTTFFMVLKLVTEIFLLNLLFFPKYKMKNLVINKFELLYYVVEEVLKL